jgi:hypothetical protein
MQRQPHPLPTIAAKPAPSEFGTGAVPDRLSWPLAGLVILVLALLSWLLILGAVFKLIGLR